jgi:predicted metal-dependent hydrolase
MTITKEDQETNIQGRRVQYTLKRSTRARYARLEVSPERGLIVTIPVFQNIDHVRQLLEEKERWIIEKLAKYSSANSDTKQLQNGDNITYLGCPLTIEVQPGVTENVNFDTGNGTVRVTAGRDGLRSTLERWYRIEARKKIEQKVENQSRLMGLSYQRITIKSQKTLWGSCSRKRNLNFNWRLIMAPEPVIDYVVIHELAHIKVMNHSKRFWQTVEKYYPDWPKYRTWLREHSLELNRKLKEP